MFSTEVLSPGIGGVEQMFYAGTVAFNTPGINSGVELCELPKNIIITRAVAVVNKAFNAGTSNVLTVGVNDAVNDLMGSGDIDESAAGVNIVHRFNQYGSGQIVKAKYAQTGNAATTGNADIYLFGVRMQVFAMRILP